METKKNLILVISKDVLYNVIGGSLQGFFHHRNYQQLRDWQLDYGLLKEIELKSFWIERDDKLEKNTSIKQLIPCTYLETPYKKIFIYRRANQREDYDESRLFNKLSCGIGGHIENEDGIKMGSVIFNGAEKKLFEKIKIEEPMTKFTLIGFINDDEDEAGKVHFGIIFRLGTYNGDKVTILDKKIANGQFMPIEQAKTLAKRPFMENWSELLLQQMLF